MTGTRRPGNALVVALLSMIIIGAQAPLLQPRTEMCPPGTAPVTPLKGACTHGPDSAATLGLRTHGGGSTARTSSGSAGTADFLGLRCSGGDGNRIEVLYAHAPGRGNLQRARPAINESMGVANGILYRSAQQTSGSRQLAVLAHTSGKSCIASVTDVTVQAKALNQFSRLISELQAQGFTRADRKYMVFGDGTNALCGIGTVYRDDRATPMNANNQGGTFALAGNGQNCWTGAVVAHELMHTLGGVQPSAAHATAGYHCNDAPDIMCYADGTARSNQRSVCRTANANRLDCNQDDYFNTNPRPGSYLATHWNTANSSFLHGGGIAAPQPPGAPESLTGQVEEDTIRLIWSAATGRVTGYRITLPDGSAITLSASTRSYTDARPTLDRDNTYTLVAGNEAGFGPDATVTVAARDLAVTPSWVPPVKDPR